MLKKSGFFCCAMLAVFVASAQTQYADKIVAVVGNNIILQSEVANTFLSAQKEERVTKPESDKCDMLNNMIAQKILVEQAVRDSLMLTDDEIEAALNNRIEQVLYYDFNGSKEAMERAANKSIYQIKEEYRQVIKDQMVASRMKQDVVKNITITPKEVEEFYNKLPASERTNIPASVELGQILLNPSVSAELEKYAYDKVADIRKQIVEDGKSFAVMAQVYSEDGNRDNGGEMEIHRKAGNLDSRFLAAAFRLQPGEVSPVFRSSFGYHIVQMVSRAGDDAKIRYIVVIPRSSTQDIEAALHKMDSTYNLLSSGKLTFGEAVNKVSNDENSKNTGGMIINPMTNSSSLQISDIQDNDIALAATDLKVGEYSKPQVVKDNSGAQKVRILYLKSRVDPHELNLKDDYSMIQNAALARKQTLHFNSWLSDKVTGYFIKIDPNYLNSCEALSVYGKALRQ